MPVIRKTLDIGVSSSDIAVAFSDLDNHDMASFFNTVAKKFISWGGNARDLQIADIVESGVLGKDGKEWIISLSDYLKEYGHE